MNFKKYVSAFCTLFILISIFNIGPVLMVEASVDTSITVSESVSLAQNLLDGDVLFMSSNGKFYNGSQKLNCADFGESSFVSEGKLMADVKVINAALGKDFLVSNGRIDVNGITVNVTHIDDVYFACVSEVGEALGMRVYSEDNREFVILSSTDKNYTNSSLSQNNEEDIDRIWRYMQFDRPSGDEIYNILLQNNLLDVHPKFLIKKSEIESFRQKISGNDYLESVSESIIAVCDGYDSKNVVPYEISENRLFGSCEDVKNRLFNLCTAYLITNNEKYAERAWLEIENACNWKDWNTSVHFLDSGEIGPGIAFAYDVLNDYLSNIDGEDKRPWIREKVTELYLDYCIGVFNGTSNFTADRGKLTSSNWGAVCGTSMFMVAMSFLGEEDETTELTQKCKYIIENSMQLLEHIATALAPEGTWFEGMGYYEYVMQHMGWFLEILDNTLSADYGFSSVNGMLELPDYLMYNQTKNGIYNRGAASHAKKNFFAPEAFIYAKLNSNAARMSLYDEFRKSMSVNTFLPQYLLFYYPDMSDDTQGYNLNLDRYYSSNGVGVMRDIWEKDTGAYVAISGGIGEHSDKGSFIFDALGERWSVDMGRNGNNLMPFLGRTETHSALVINPSAQSIGQSDGQAAECINFESKERGSMMIYDLTGAYGEWVNDYKRGFLLDDHRNTLTIRDELVLKDNSDLVWNMITGADINISSDGKSAVLTQNDKKLMVTALCSENDWHFEIADSLAPTGGWADAVVGDGFTGTVTFTAEQQQTFALGYRKLILKAVGNGDVNITVKLTPDIYGEDFEDISDVSLSEWSIPDGEKKEVLILNSVNEGDVFNSGKDILISEKIYGNPECVKLLINNCVCDEITTPQDDNVYNLVIPRDSLKLAGNAMLTLEAQYDSYTLKKNIPLHICREYELNTRINLDFSKEYSSGILHCVDSGKFPGYASYVTSDGVLTVDISRPDGASGGEPYIEINQNLIDAMGLNDSDIIHMSYDVTPSDGSVNLMQSLYGKKFKLFVSGADFFDEGYVGCEENKTYHIEFMINRAHKLYRVYISDKHGNPVAEKRGIYDTPYDFEYRLYFSTSAGTGSIIFDNLKLQTSKYICPDLDITEVEGKYALSGILKCGGDMDVSGHRSYVGYYNKDNVMTHINEIDIFASETVYQELSPASDTKLIKFFFWDKNLIPVTGLNVLDIKN